MQPRRGVHARQYKTRQAGNSETNPTQPKSSMYKLRKKKKEEKKTPSLSIHARPGPISARPSVRALRHRHACTVTKETPDPIPITPLFPFFSRFSALIPHIFDYRLILAKLLYIASSLHHTVGTVLSTPRHRRPRVGPRCHHQRPPHGRLVAGADGPRRGCADARR